LHSTPVASIRNCSSRSGTALAPSAAAAITPSWIARLATTIGSTRLARLGGCSSSNSSRNRRRRSGDSSFMIARSSLPSSSAPIGFSVCSGEMCTSKVG